MLCALPLHFTLIYSFTLKFDYILVNFVVFYIYLDIINFEIVKLNKKHTKSKLKKTFTNLNGWVKRSHESCAGFILCTIKYYNLYIDATFFFGEYIWSTFACSNSVSLLM